MPALAKGGFISDEERSSVAKKISYYSTISERAILQHNLDVPTRFFWKELLRDESGYTVGRLDSRYLGLDRSEAGSSPDYNAELKSWLHSFTPAINYYIREELKFKTDVPYAMFGDVHPWDKQNDNTRDDLRQAKYTMWNIDPSGRMQDRLSFKGYRSGHMMYLRREDLKTANDDLRTFILNSSNTGKSAKY